MRPVLAITHLPKHGKLGLTDAPLLARGVGVRRLNMYDHDTLPALGEVAAVASFGGQMSVTEISRHPFLEWELGLMREALDEGVPVLGMCLGAQVLALASGGEVRRLERRYVGWPELQLTAAGRADALFSAVSDGLPVLKWHSDGIFPARDDAVLAETGTPGCAIFRAGEAAWGSQMHLETTPDILFDEWLADPLELDGLAETGADAEAFTADARRRLPVQMEAFRPVFERFADLVAERERAAPLGRR